MQRERRATILLLAAGLALAGPRPAAADEAAEGAQHVRAFADRIIGVMRQGPSPEQRAAKLRPLLASQIDVGFLGPWLAGRHWRKLSPADRAAYLRALPKYLVRSYAKRLARYHGETLVVKHAEASGDREVTVTTHLVDPKDPPPLVIKWRLRRGGGDRGGFKVRDVVVQNISMALNLRREFRAILSRDDGRIDGLIAALEGRGKAQLSPGESRRGRRRGAE